MDISYSIGLALIYRQYDVYYADDTFFDILAIPKTEHLDEYQSLFFESTKETNGKIKRLNSPVSQNIYYYTSNIKLKNQPLTAIVLIDMSNHMMMFHNIKILTKNNQLYRCILDNLQDGISVSDKTGKIVYCNDALERLSGIKKELLLNHSVFDMEKEGLLRHTCNGKIIASKAPVTIVNPWYNGMDCLLSGSPIFDSKGDLQYAFCIARYVPKLQQLQHEIEKTASLSIIYKQELEKITMNQSMELVESTNKEMMAIYELAFHVANVNTPILILGETGVGKDFLASYIHQISSRKNEPFLKINCSAIPEQLLESELFGYEPGSFTGASAKGKMGLFELAGNGTLFLDEIGDMGYNLQSKLLSVLQDKTIYPIGANKPIEINARIIAATNADLKMLMEEKKFRMDLYYRLNVINFKIPPLRNRKEDIIHFANEFLVEFNNRHGKNRVFSPELYISFLNYNWPGNIREMKNMIERIVIISKQDYVDETLFAAQIQSDDLQTAQISFGSRICLKGAVEHFESNFIQGTLKKSKTLKEAAKILDIDISTLVRKKKKYQI